MADARAEVQRGWGDVGEGLRGSFSKGDYKGIGTRIGGDIVGGISSQFGMLGNVAGSIATALGPAGVAALGIGAAVAVAGMGIKSCVSEAASWETQMVGVKKVLGDISDTDFSKLSSELSDIQARTGMSSEEITGAAAGAGRMGIDSSEIAEYTETILMMADAWEVPAESASNAIGKMGSVVKPAEMAWADFARSAGSAINDLADSMSTSEASIVTGVSKLGGTMAMLKPSPDQISGWYALTAQLQAFGMTAETSGESIKDAFAYMMRDEGDIAGLLDMDTSEFQSAIREDAIGTVQELAVAISELPIEEQGAALALFGATGGQAMGMLAGKVDPITGEIEGLSEALDTANSAWEEASSLEKSYAEKQGNLNTQLDIFGGKIDDVQRKIGGVLLPVLTEAMTVVNALTDDLIDLGERGWGAITGIDEKMGAFGIDEMVGYALNPTSAVESAVGWGEGKLGGWFGWGEDIGEDLAAGVGEGTEDLGEEVAENLASDEAKKAAEDAGKGLGEHYAKAFDDTVAAYVKSGMSRELAVMMGLGAGSDIEALNMYNAYDKASPKHTLVDMGEIQVGDINPGTLTFKLIEDDWTLRYTDPQGNTIGETRIRASRAAGLGLSKPDIVNYLLDKLIASNEMSTHSADRAALQSLDMGDIGEVSGEVQVEASVSLSDTIAGINELEAELNQKVEEALSSQEFGAELDLSTMIAAGFTDIETVMADISDDAAAAFSDGFVDRAEVDNIVDRLRAAKWADPAAFEAMGGDAALAFYEPLQKKLMDLEYTLQDIATLEAQGFEVPVWLEARRDELVGSINDTLASEDWKILVEAEVTPSAEKTALSEALFWEDYGGSKVKAGLGEFADDMYVLGEAAEGVGGSFSDAYQIITNPWQYEAGTVALAKDYLLSVLPEGVDPESVDAIAAYFVANTEAGISKAKDEISKQFETDLPDWWSSFGTWLESEAGAGMFKQSYIGPTDEWAGPGLGKKEMVIDADTSAADLKLSAVEERISIPKIAPVDVDQRPAMEGLEKIRAEIMKPVKIPVDVDLTTSIQGLYKTIEGMIYEALGENNTQTAVAYAGRYSGRSR